MSQMGSNLSVSGKSPSPGPRQAIGFHDIKEILQAKKQNILLVVLGALMLTSFVHFMMPSYTAQTSLFVQRAQNSAMQAMLGRMTGAGAMAAGKTNEYQDKYLFYLSSHDFRVAAAKLMLSMPEYKADTDRLLSVSFIGKIISGILYAGDPDGSSAHEAKIERLAQALRKAKFQKKGFDNIEVSLTAGKPEIAVRLANFITDAAVKLITQQEIADMTQARDYLKAELASADKRLKDIDSEVVSFKKGSRIASTEQGVVRVVENYGALKRRIEENRIKVDLNDRLIAQLTGELQKDKTELLTSGARQLKGLDVVNELFKRIQELRYKRVLLEAQGIDDHNRRDLVQVDQLIDEQVKQLRELSLENGATDADLDSLLGDKEGLITKIHKLKRENQYLETQSVTLSKALEKLAGTVNDVPEATQTLVGFNRDIYMEYGMVQEMKRRIVEIDVEMISLQNKFKVQQKATLAAIPKRYGWIPKSIFATIFATVFAGLAFLGLESLDTTLKGKEELQALGVYPIGSVPNLETVSVGALLRRLLPASMRREISTNALLAWKNHSDAPEIMAFNHIRARILKMRDPNGRPAKLIAVVSAKPGEGKSYVAANIALSLATFEKKVLLIDCDLRRSSLPGKLGIKNERGLTDILLDGKSLDATLVRAVMPGLDVLTTGHSAPRPSELIGSAKFAELLESLRQEYDFVIADTPAVLPVVDSLVVSNLADAVVYVATHRVTTWKDAQSAMDRFGHLEKKTIFSVLNRVPEIHEYVYISSHSKPVRVTTTSSAEATTPTSTVVGAEVNVKEQIKRFKESLGKEDLS